MLPLQAMLLSPLIAAPGGHPPSAIEQPSPSPSDRLSIVEAATGFLIVHAAAQGVPVRPVPLGKDLRLDGALFTGVGAPEKRENGHVDR